MGALLTPVERALYLLETILLVVFLSAMIFLAFFQVLLRDFFHSGILWADPLLRHMVVWLGFLGAAFAASQGKHFAWEMPRPKNPALGRMLGVISNLSGALASFFLALAARQYAREEKMYGHTLFRIGGFSFPSWASADIIWFGFLLVGLHFTLRVFVPLQEEMK